MTELEESQKGAMHATPARDTENSARNESGALQGQLQGEHAAQGVVQVLQRMQMKPPRESARDSAHVYVISPHNGTEIRTVSTITRQSKSASPQQVDSLRTVQPFINVRDLAAVDRFRKERLE